LGNFFRSEDSPEIEVHLSLALHWSGSQVSNLLAQYQNSPGWEGHNFIFARIDPVVSSPDGVYEHVFTAEDLWEAGYPRGLYDELEDPFGGADPYFADPVVQVRVVKVFDDGSIDENWNGGNMVSDTAWGGAWVQLPRGPFFVEVAEQSKVQLADC
tara:strand:- start:96 stop:563 length:468 start_codon:yes stop_codon:yes gene_type:complete